MQFGKFFSHDYFVTALFNVFGNSELLNADSQLS